MRLGSRGPGDDHKSLCFCPQAFAKPPPRVRECRASLAVEMVARRRTVITFGLASCRHVSKVSIVTGVGGGSWSRNEERSSLLDLPSGGPGRDTQNGRHFWTCLSTSRPKSVNCHRDPGGGGAGVAVAKRRTVVGFGFASGESRGERRQKRRVRREERREERKEMREERGERREEREREERGERREERGERREERRGEREKRGERSEERERERE